MFNPNSNDDLSLLFFGGTTKEEVVEPVDGTCYKSGKKKGEMKFRKVLKEKRIEGLGLIPLDEWKTKKEGVYQTNEEVLHVITTWFRDDPEALDLGITTKQGIAAKQIAEKILKIRGLKKQLSTYYISTEELIYDCDSCVHPQFSHVATDTGRLGCKAPNVQNQPDRAVSLAKCHFTSRFIPNGTLLSADYGQLEICVQAQISQDRNYINDVIKGIDFHVKRLALKEDIDYEEAEYRVESDPMWKEKRKAIKGFSFARAYGAGIAKIASQTGLNEEDIKDLIEKEEKEYPQLKQFYINLGKQVDSHGYYTGFTGRRYQFKKYPAPAWMRRKGINENYSPTEIKNYIVQGTATADIVLVMLGKFWREKALLNRDKYLLINTVHDSVMLDCKKEFVDDAKKDLQILKEVAIMTEKKFSYQWTVPINIDISEGQSWYEC